MRVALLILIVVASCSLFILSDGVRFLLIPLVSANDSTRSESPSRPDWSPCDGHRWARGRWAPALICPPKYFIIENRCVRPYTLHMNDYFEIIMEYGQRACDEDGAHLPIIRSDEDNDMFNRIAQAFLEPRGMRIYLVLGLVCDEESNQLRWVDGSALEYDGPAGSDSVHYNCSASHSMPASMVPENRWDLLPNGDLKAFTALCVLEEKIEPTEEVTEEPDRRCGDYERMEESIEEDVHCFKVFTEPQSWQQAHRKCTADFGSMETINSAQENEFYWKVATRHNVTEGMHIGAHQSQADDSRDWAWIDGEIPITSKSYNNFIRSFPISGAGKCASMVTESVSAVWVNVDCDEVKLPFICQRGDFSLIPSSCPNAAPQTGEEVSNFTTLPGREQSQIFSPSFPNSDISCEYFLAVSSGKLVEIEVISLISDRHTDYLEILEGSSGTNVLANLTGTLLKSTKFTTARSNVLRVNWKPSGSREGRGFKIRYIEVSKMEEEPTTTEALDHLATTTKSASFYEMHCLILVVLVWFAM